MAAVAYYRQGLTGDGATDLDEIDGAILNDGDPAFVFTGVSLYCYRLDSTSGAAASSPDIIEPVDNSGSKRWILQGIQNATGGTKLISKSANYTITASDVENDDLLMVLVDPSAGTVNITLPAPADYDSKLIMVTTLSTNGNSVVTKRSTGTEFHTGYEKGDFFSVTSDGTSNRVMDERITIRGFLAKTLDQSIGANSAEEVWDTNYSAEVNVGGWWDTTGHQLDIGFDCTLRLEVRGGGLQPRLNGSTSGDNIFNGNGELNNDGSHTLDLSSGDYIEGWTYNGTAAAVNFSGASTKDASMLKWELIRRIR